MFRATGLLFLVAKAWQDRQLRNGPDFGIRVPGQALPDGSVKKCWLYRSLPHPEPKLRTWQIVAKNERIGITIWPNSAPIKTLGA
jgi:hypothetical protein